MTPKIDVPRALDTVALLSQFGHAGAKNLADYTTALVGALREIADVYEEFENGEPVACQLDATCKAARDLLPTSEARPTPGTGEE